MRGGGVRRERKKRGGEMRKRNLDEATRTERKGRDWSKGEGGGTEEGRDAKVPLYVPCTHRSTL